MLVDSRWKHIWSHLTYSSYGVPSNVKEHVVLKHLYTLQFIGMVLSDKR